MSTPQRTIPCPTLIALGLLACLGFHPTANADTTLKRESFGKTADGENVEIFTLTNSQRLKARVTTWGAGLVEMQVPDRNGKMADVTLGFDKLDGYLGQHPFFGSTAGRYANRIAKGKFTLDGKEYTLATNNGANHLHGGLKGFDKKNWNAAEVGNGVRFTYTSPAYWNLAGAGEGDILGHQLTLHASKFTPVDAGSIPTGKIEAVAGGPMDFTKAKPIAKDFPHMTGQPGGYDHNFVLDKPEAGAMTLAAELYEPKSGRLLKISTAEPGIQFYTGNYLDGTLTGKGGEVYKKNYGLCLETQHFPDSPNHANFPSTVRRPGQTYRTSTVHEFSVK
jgi:aldose 1-epimerase